MKFVNILFPGEVIRMDRHFLFLYQKIRNNVKLLCTINDLQMAVKFMYVKKPFAYMQLIACDKANIFSMCTRALEKLLRNFIWELWPKAISISLRIEGLSSNFTCVKLQSLKVVTVTILRGSIINDCEYQNPIDWPKNIQPQKPKNANYSETDA